MVTLRRLMAEGRFPRPLLIGRKLRVWDVLELQALLDRLAREREERGSKQNKNPATARTVTGPRGAIDDRPGGAIAAQNNTTAPAGKLLWSARNNPRRLLPCGAGNSTAKNHFSISPAMPGPARPRWRARFARPTDGRSCLRPYRQGRRRNAKKGCDDATTIDALIYRPRWRCGVPTDPPCEDLCGAAAATCGKSFVGRTLNNRTVTPLCRSHRYRRSQHGRRADGRGSPVLRHPGAGARRYRATAADRRRRLLHRNEPDSS